MFISILRLVPVALVASYVQISATWAAGVPVNERLRFSVDFRSKYFKREPCLSAERYT